jgi:hypothetical protein
MRKEIRLENVLSSTRGLENTLKKWKRLESAISGMRGLEIIIGRKEIGLESAPSYW